MLLVLFRKSLSFFSVLVFALCSLKSFAEAPVEILGAKTVDVTDARKLYEQGAIFVDVRDENAWNVGHILGAVHLDFNEDDFVVLYASNELDRETPLVFYCDSPLAPIGAMASFFAASWGYKNVYFFRDGYYAWLAYDFPVEFQQVAVR